HRAAEQIALSVAHAVPAQIGKLLRRLDAFRDERHAEALAEIDDRVEHRPADRVGADGLDEQLVDLDVVEIELLQKGKTIVPGAEIIDGDGAAKIAKLLHDLADGETVIDD